MKSLLIAATLFVSNYAFAFTQKTLSCDYMVTVYTENNGELIASFVNVLLPSRDGNLVGGYHSATNVKMNRNEAHTLLAYQTKNGSVLLMIQKESYTVIENYKGQQLTETHSCSPSLNPLH